MTSISSCEHEIQRIMIERGKTLSLAESMTGGAIAARLTKVPGSSNYFLGSIVAYSNDIKMKLLHVSPQTLQRHGAVSAEVVKEMALGIQQQTGSDFAIAITGIAGPGGATPTKPVGTVWGAIIAKNHDPIVWSFHLDGSRNAVIDQSVEILLRRFLSMIKVYR